MNRIAERQNRRRGLLMAAKPCREDFTSPAETIFHVAPGQTPDSHNRVRFIAYWLDSNVPGGVRGQVFHADLDRHVADIQRRGGQARVVTA